MDEAFTPKQVPIVQLKDLREPLEEIVKSAGEAIMNIYDQPALFDVEHKADKSPLTAADKAANQIICDQLRRLPKVFPIVSEENKMVTYEARKNYPYFWCVDPLDGTKEFIKRNGEFTVNIALVKSDRPVLGVIYIPVTHEVFFAAKGEGSWYKLDTQWQRLGCRSFTMVDRGLKVLCSRSHLSTDTQVYIEQFDAPELVARGSSLKFLEIAKGNAHLYPRLGPTMEWDTAAAQIILEEAGGKIVEFATDLPMRYNKKSLLNPDFIAFGTLVGETVV